MQKSSFHVHEVKKGMHRTRHFSGRIHGSVKIPLWKRLFSVLIGLTIVGILSLFFLVLLLAPFLPDVNNVQNLVAIQSSVIGDREGNILYTIHGEENRKVVPFDQISKYAGEAILAIEDDQFYRHSGIDIPGILKSICGEFGVCQKRGGSTITQQFVKNAFLSSERTYTRKLKELILAVKLEHAFTKDQILEMYLNRIPYGSNVYGVELAARAFFSKSAKDLTIAEAAILAAIPKAPSYFSPYGNNKYVQVHISDEEVIKKDIRSEADLVHYNAQSITKGLLGHVYSFGEGADRRDIYVKGRVDFVLERMNILGYISTDEVEAALKEANEKEFNDYRDAIVAPHFVMYVRELLEEKYGKEQVEKGGLKITTTIDPLLQSSAEEIVSKYAETNKTRYGATNESLLAVDPNNGQILAMVGSADYWNDEIDGKVNITLRPRLPGSSFKPIVYAAAFLKGYAPTTVLYDVMTKFGSWYEPDNFDGTFMGPMSMRQALAQSRNVPAVKAGYLAGIPNVIDLARKMGIQLNQPDDWYGLSLALGAGEARLIDMVLAYSVFANGGYKMNPIAILKIEDRRGNILEEYQAPEDRKLILDPQIAYLINDILSDVSARPEGWWRDRLTIPGQINAAKTGTSNKRKSEDEIYPFDTWTFGYTRRLVAGVWAGNNDGSHLLPKASGLDTAGGIWHDFMVAATKGRPAEKFEKPEGISFVNVAKSSGKLPSEYTPEADIITGVFAGFAVPNEVDDSYQFVEIDKVSGKLATEFTPFPAREKKAFFRHHAILPDNPNWEDAVRKWAEENHQDEEPPTEYDDVHTANTEQVKPDIRIVSPVLQGVVSAPYVDVVVDINSPAGVAQVDYYWDDTLVETVEKPPYRGQLKLAKLSAKEGSLHVIRAVLFDALYHSNQSSIEVKVGQDSGPPEVRFLYPKAGASISAGSSMSAQVDAYDSNGAIKKVEFYFNDEFKERMGSAPYLWQFITPSASGSYTIKVIAYDYADNQSTASINVQVVATESVDLQGKARILKPVQNSSFNQGESIPVQIYLDEEVRSQLTELSVTAKSGKGTQVDIAKTVGDLKTGGAQLYTFIWDAPTAGQYELFFKMALQNGKIRFSEKVAIVVR